MNQDTFFNQSSSDALNDFVYSCKVGKGDKWDFIVLTSANDQQADSFRVQVDRRAKEKWLPIGTKIMVVPDYKNKRIGSGGATLNVIREIVCTYGHNKLLNSKILVINSGGDSKRIPQYSACGKLFAPVPRLLPNGRVSTLFDEMLILASGIPGRIGNGMMIFPSDTEMLFNSLQVDLLSCDAAGLSMKASVVEGKEHGVFLQSNKSNDNRNFNVSRFLHKMPENLLRKEGAVDDKDMVDIDTGCIWLGKKIVRTLYETISKENEIEIAQFEKYVNPEVCLNFYSDFVYPLADDSSLEEYLDESSENGMSDELIECRKSLWDKLHSFSISLVKMVPARYIHFGMTHELYDLFVKDIDNYSYLGWRRITNSNAKKGTVLNSFVYDSGKIPNECFIENSTVEGTSVLGERTILSNVDVDSISLPGNCVFSAIKLKNEKYVCRIYGIDDNPKASSTASFIGGSVERLVELSGYSKEDIWGDKPATIWNAKIYPEVDTMAEAVETALIVRKLVLGEADKKEIDYWKSFNKHSLESSFYEADISWLMDRQDHIAKQIRLERFFDLIYQGADSQIAIDELCKDKLKEELEFYVEGILNEIDKNAFPYNMRLSLALSDIYKRYFDNNVEKVNEYEDRAYDIVKKYIMDETFSRYNMDYMNCRLDKERVVVELPVRVNFCGSPSDAAPYCLEHGGTMIDGTLLLKGKKPISVVAEKISEGFELVSEDQGDSIRIEDVSNIQRCGNPFDPFALHKAVLVATGLIPVNEKVDMKEFCKKIGGGIRLETKVDVPKGSGLGTSSIIAAAAIKAIHQLLGNEPSNEMIYSQVFLAEQLMNTGGGWQDQVGGLTDGIKYFTSLPGAYQDITVDTLSIDSDVMGELNERFALIFSGQRRLARNVLREEMNQCIRNNEEAIRAIAKIQEYCAIMRHHILKGQITEFAKYITKQFELVKILDKGASNTCIEYIFDTIDDLIDGKSICGAGGGGFLQVVLKEGVSKTELKERIASEFADCGVEVWDCELI